MKGALRLAALMLVITACTPAGDSACPIGFHGDGSAAYEGACEAEQQYAEDRARFEEALREREERETEEFDRQAREAYEDYRDIMNEAP